MVCRRRMIVEGIVFDGQLKQHRLAANFSKQNHCNFDEFFEKSQKTK